MERAKTKVKLRATSVVGEHTTVHDLPDMVRCRDAASQFTWLQVKRACYVSVPFSCPRNLPLETHQICFGFGK